MVLSKKLVRGKGTFEIDPLQLEEAVFSVVTCCSLPCPDWLHCLCQPRDAFFRVQYTSVPIWKTYFNNLVFLTNKSVWTGNTDLLSSTLQPLAKDRIRGKEERKKKPRQTAKQRPDYKSLNCNQKGEEPSAAASLLFHCSFSRRQLVPLQNITVRWWRRTASSWKILGKSQDFT